jgi:polo-like kinase 1
VIYINKKGDIFSYQLSNAMDSNNKEMTKRLKYTKEVLTNMVTTAPGKSKDTKTG